MSGRRWQAREVGEMVDRFSSQGAAALQTTRKERRCRDERGSTPQLHRPFAAKGKPCRGRARATGRSTPLLRYASPQVAFALGYIWLRGRVQTGAGLRLRCPTSLKRPSWKCENSWDRNSRVQRKQGYTACQVTSTLLVQALIGKYGFPPAGQP